MPSKNKTKSSAKNNAQKPQKTVQKSGFNTQVSTKIHNQSKSLIKRDDLIKDYKNRNSANVVRIQKKEVERFASNKNQFLGKRDKRNIFDDFDQDENQQDDLLLQTHKGVAIDDLDNEELGGSVASDQEVDEIDQEMLEGLRFHGFDNEADAKADNIDPTKQKKSKKEIYEEVIKKSKKAKADRQEFKEDYMDSVKNLDEEVNDLRKLITCGKRLKRSDYQNEDMDDYALMAHKLGNERILAPQKVEKKVDNKAEERRKKKIVNELDSDSEDGVDMDTGVDGLKDGLKKNRKFRDNEQLKSHKEARKYDKTLDFLKNLNDVYFYLILAYIQGFC